mgnify:CR=1 FL=1
MILPELLGFVGIVLGTILGVVIGLQLDLGGWIIGAVVVGLLLGWVAGVGLAVSPWMSRRLQKSWEQEQKRTDGASDESADTNARSR